MLCAIVFRFTTSQIASAHPLIGIACCMALFLGLHLTGINSVKLSPQELKSRNLVSTSVLKLDLYAILISAPYFIQKSTFCLAYVTAIRGTSEQEHDFATATSMKHLILLEVTWSSQKFVAQKEPENGLAPSIHIKHFEDPERALRRWQEDLSSLLAAVEDNVRHTM